MDARLQHEIERARQAMRRAQATRYRVTAGRARRQLFRGPTGVRAPVHPGARDGDRQLGQEPPAR